MREKDEKESEGTRERERQRERSRERMRERPPEIQSESLAQKNSTDILMEDQMNSGVDTSQIPCTNEMKETGSVVPETIGVCQNAEEHGEERNNGKVPKVAGTFMGTESLMQREEDWMIEENTKVQNGPRKILSYREALKPKATEEEKQGDTSRRDNSWDGNLYLSDVKEMMQGVTITDTPSGPHIEFSEEEKQRLEKYWSKSLIIKLLGDTIGFMQMRRKVQMLWGKAGKIDLSDIGNGFMIATFHSSEDYWFALDGGPWIIQNHYLTVQTWKRNFNPWNEKIQSVALWVRLPGLPGDYYDRKFFYSLGNKIGRAIRVDEMTLNRARTMYARMCVEVDLNKPLLPSYTVDGNKLKIEYEGLHLICFSCGKFGHALEYCPIKIARDQAASRAIIESKLEGTGANKEENPMNQMAEQGGGVYGGWMVVQDPRKNRRFQNRDGKGGEGPSRVIRKEKTAGASRFAVLADDVDLGEKEAKGADRRIPLKEITNVNNNRKEEKKQSLTKLKVGMGGSEGSELGKKNVQKGGVIMEKTKEVKKQDTEGEIRRQKSGQTLGKKEISQKEKEVKVGYSMKQKGGQDTISTQLNGNQVDQKKEVMVSKEKNQMGQKGESSNGLNKNQGNQSGLTEKHGPDECDTSVDMLIDEDIPPDLIESSHYLGLSAVENMMLEQHGDDDNWGAPGGVDQVMST